MLKVTPKAATMVCFNLAVSKATEIRVMSLIFIVLEG
jgi:hypothetical protein